MYSGTLIPIGDQLDALGHEVSVKYTQFQSNGKMPEWPMMEMRLRRNVLFWCVDDACDNANNVNRMTNEMEI